jgi:hypothetical protein
MAAAAAPVRTSGSVTAVALGRFDTVRAPACADFPSRAQVNGHHTFRCFWQSRMYASDNPRQAARIIANLTKKVQALSSHDNPLLVCEIWIIYRGLAVCAKQHNIVPKSFQFFANIIAEQETSNCLRLKEILDRLMRRLRIGEGLSYRELNRVEGLAVGEP